jgi:hypothetical protein
MRLGNYITLDTSTLFDSVAGDFDDATAFSMAAVAALL